MNIRMRGRHLTDIASGEAEETSDKGLHDNEPSRVATGIKHRFYHNN